MRTSRVALSLAIAAAAGTAIAWWGLPIIQRIRWAAAVASPDAAERADAWDVLADPLRDPLPYDRTAAIVNAALLEAPSAALIDAAFALDRVDRFRWDTLPHATLARMLEALAVAGHLGPVIERIEAAPLDLPPTMLTPAVPPLVSAPDEALRRRGLAATAAWAGPDRLRSVLPQPSPAGLGREVDLLLAAAAEPPATRPVEALLGFEAARTEAHLMALVRADPDDASFTLDIETRWTADPRPAFAQVLRYATDPSAAERLETLAERGDRTAVFARQLRDARGSARLAERVLSDPRQPCATRRLAAWRWNDVPIDVVRALLDEGVTDDDGAVCAAVLLAERRLDRQEASERAERWIRSLNDDEKRAGALLAALLDEHGELLRSAHAIEDVPAVRIAQRLALEAMSARGAPPPDLIELAARVPIEARFDATLCLLIAGHSPAARELTSRPHGQWTLTVQRRAWMIERFFPAWHAWAGRPLGGSREALDLHFDALDARAILDGRRLRFDERTRRFAPVPSDTLGAQVR